MKPLHVLLIVAAGAVAAGCANNERSRDLANPAVRQHILDDALASGVIAAGTAVAVDNIADVNSFSSCGIQAVDGWRPLFSGQAHDPAFAADRART